MPRATGRVLVVEDHDDTREAMAELLRSEGYIVDTARDGAAALDVLGTEPAYDLVLLDWRLPKMSGVEFLRAVRASRFAKLPVSSSARMA